MAAAATDRLNTAVSTTSLKALLRIRSRAVFCESSEGLTQDSEWHILHPGQDVLHTHLRVLKMPQNDSARQQTAASDQPTTEDSPTSAASRSLGFDDGDRRFLSVLLIVFLVVLVFQWGTLREPDPLVWKHGPAHQLLFRVDINSATWVEWMQLDGIGQTMAHRIVADREVNGPFSSVDDLRRVDGIGKTTLDRIRPWLIIRED